MPFILLFNVCIVFLVVARSPVIFAMASHSKSFVAFRTFATRPHAYKPINNAKIANITGDLATTKKTIQTLNNRINGMHSPKVAENELLLQLMQKQGQQQNGKIIGG